MALLSLDPSATFPGDRDGRHQLIVRDFYPALFRRLQQEPMWLLTGVPGTGKSWFIWYAMYQILQLPEPPAIVWQSHNYNALQRVLFKDGEAHIGGATNFNEELGKPSTWLFSDGIMPGYTKARAILVSSPKRSIYKDWVKGRSSIELTMSLWTWPEIVVAWQHLYSSNPQLSLDRVRRCFEDYYGGVPRLVLEEPSRCGDAARDDVLMRKALGRTNLKQVAAAAGGAYDMGPEASHVIVHQDGDRSTFGCLPCCLATPHVADLFSQKMLRNNVGAQLAAYVVSADDADAVLCGMLFESAAHRACINGGKFKYRYLDVPSSSMDTHARSSHGLCSRSNSAATRAAAAPATDTAGAELPPLLQIGPFPEGEVRFAAADRKDDISVRFRAAVQASQAPAYLRPSHSRHPGIDACILPDRLLQMTVTKKRSAVDEDVLECHLQCLPDLDIYYLDHLVPSNTFKAFQVPALRRKAGSRVAKTMQRVFEVPVKDPLDPVT